jgi:hypothetical protein
VECVGRHAAAVPGAGCSRMPPRPQRRRRRARRSSFMAQPGVPLSRIHPELLVGSCDDTVTIAELVPQCSAICV